MILPALDIPEDRAALAEWLERKLVAAQFGEFLAELAILQTPASAPARFSLDGRIPEIVGAGLTVLTLEELQALLASPTLLIELQETVLAANSPYWDRRLAAIDDYDSMANRISGRLKASIGDSSAARVATAASSVRRPNQWRLLLALAACALIAAFLYQWNNGRTANWGWNSDAALAQTGRPDEYLNRLGSSAKEWFDQRPTSAQAVGQRLDELRRGCDRLIAAEHPSLEPADATWLREKCRAWKKTFDEQALALRNGADPIAVRNEVDAVVNRLIKALQARAAELSA